MVNRKCRLILHLSLSFTMQVLADGDPTNPLNSTLAKSTTTIAPTLHTSSRMFSTGSTNPTNVASTVSTSTSTSSATVLMSTSTYLNSSTVSASTPPLSSSLVSKSTTLFLSTMSSLTTTLTSSTVSTSVSPFSSNIVTSSTTSLTSSTMNISSSIISMAKLTTLSQSIVNPTVTKADIEIQKTSGVVDDLDYPEIVFSHIYTHEVEQILDKNENISPLVPNSFVPKAEFSKLTVKYKAFKQKTSEVKVKEMKVENLDDKDTEDDLPRVTTTTVDPISEILANVVIMDIADYLPKGYVFRYDESEEVEKDGNNNVENINDILIKKVDNTRVKFKPGKLNGKKLAAISKELKEAELYYKTFGGKKPTVEVVNNIEHVKDLATVLEEIKTVSMRKKIKLARPITSRPKASPPIKSAPLVSRFRQVGEEITTNQGTGKVQPSRPFTSRPITSRPLRSRPLTSAPKTTTPGTTTTTTVRSTTPGVCGAFCSLAGTIVIKSGLEWSEELLHSFTEVYKEVTEEVVGEMSKVFEHVYFGSAFEFASVEAYSKQDDKVLVDFYVQFSGIVFNITTKVIKDAFEEALEVESNKLMMGKFEIDITSTYFLVVDTSIPLETITSEKYEANLPDWAWLVVVGGMISTFIIAFFGVIVGVQRFRHNQVVKTKVLNPRTLDAFRGQRHFARVEVDHDTAYATDKRDMWTLQKVKQAELKKSKTSLHRKLGVDSGRSSASSGGEKYFSDELAQSGKVSSPGKSGERFYGRHPLIGKGRSSTNHNDSNAELLGGFENTTLDESGDIIENDVTDKDTSYENDNDDYEERVDCNDGFESRDVFARNSHLRVSRADLIDSLGDQGLTFYNFDSSVDSLEAVSDGSSEML